MATFTQETRLLELMTPLGRDKLLIRSIDGTEGISQLFSFRIEAFAANDTVVDFSQLIGQAISVRVLLDVTDSAMPQRYFHGLVRTLTRGARGFHNTAYTLEVVPSLWTLSRRTDCRVFQSENVPDILKKVLVGFPVNYEIQGTFEPRDYCTQYRESDLDFAHRLMEEEGIYYFFRHEQDKHTMVVANTPTTHKALGHSPQLHYDPEVGGVEDFNIVYAWEKSQTLRSGKVTLWDHSFELPHKSLEAQEVVMETLAVGTVTHKLKVGGNDKLELFDYPGGFAERFDGVAPAGGDRAGDLQKIFQDNLRTAKIRMQQESANAINLTAYTGYLGIEAGAKFTLQNHYEDNGEYVITRSHFSIPQMGGYAGDEELGAPPPEIVFNCIPTALPYRPQQITQKPTVHGTQTAVVVGPSGEEIFTDKYGRIKVQFLWERTAPYSPDSSCWVRCSFPWAGKQFGFISIPRIGQEVVVAFEEGDPDQPIVVGSVYNADMMPPYTLPDEKTKSTFKSRSSVGGGGFNELRFEDKKDNEEIFIHAQKNMDIRVLNDSKEWIGNDTHLIVKRDQLECIERDVHREVKQDLVEKVGRDQVRVVAGKEAVEVTGSSTTKVTGNIVIKSAQNLTSEAGLNALLKGGMNVCIEAGMQLTLKAGGSFITIGPDGVTISGVMVKINSGGSAGSVSMGSFNATKAPTAAIEAGTAAAGGAQTYTGGGQRGTGEAGATPAPAPPPAPTHNPNSPENQEKTHWVGIRLKDRTGKPIPGQAYRVVLPNGDVCEGTLDDEGKAKVEHTDPGNCQVSFPGLADWEKG